MIKFPTEWKNKNMFQTTNQIWWFDSATIGIQDFRKAQKDRSFEITTSTPFIKLHKSCSHENIHWHGTSHMSSGQNRVLSLIWHAHIRVLPYRLWGFQYSRRYQWGIGSSPIAYEGLVQPQKGQEEARLESKTAPVDSQCLHAPFEYGDFTAVDGTNIWPHMEVSTTGGSLKWFIYTIILENSQLKWSCFSFFQWDSY